MVEGQDINALISTNIERRISAFCGHRDEWVILDENPPLLKNVGEDPFSRSGEEHVKHGIIVIDKPPGPTSHEIVAWVKNMLKVRKAGHGGTLEPTVYEAGARLSQSDRRSANRTGEIHKDNASSCPFCQGICMCDGTAW